MGRFIRIQIVQLTSILPVLFVSVCMVASVAAQTAQVERGFWSWTESSDHHKAVVQVTTDSGAGSGVLVHVFRTRRVGKGYEGLVLTAHHVVSDAKLVKVAYQNGKKAKDCTVVSVNKDVDVAFLRVWVPDGAKEVPLAKAAARPGDTLEFCGYGGGLPLDQLRHFKATSDDPTNTKQIFSSVSLLSGDSGGPVFNSQGQVVGIISGGWFWFDGASSKSGLRQTLTWPARSSNLDPILKLVADMKQWLPEAMKANRQ